jgi:uncharacterized protein YjiS (DUF1127 family)
MQLQLQITDKVAPGIGKHNLPGLLAARLLAARLRLWQERRRTRLHLAQLPSYLLRDIGLERHDVLHESAKPFWR